MSILPTLCPSQCIKTVSCGKSTSVSLYASPTQWINEFPPLKQNKDLISLGKNVTCFWVKVRYWRKSIPRTGDYQEIWPWEKAFRRRTWPQSLQTGYWSLIAQKTLYVVTGFHKTQHSSYTMFLVYFPTLRENKREYYITILSVCPALHFCKNRTIFMKFDTNFTPLESTPTSYFLISYYQ